MQNMLFYLGIVFAALAVVLLIASVVMFFQFHVPELWRDSRGELERRQIEEIRNKNSDAANQRGKVNVFEELEKKAKVKRANTQSLNLSTGNTGNIRGGAASSNAPGGDRGTVVLSKSEKPLDPNFVIKKNIMYVSTSEVI